jgi:hypothetical protein
MTTVDEMAEFAMLWEMVQEIQFTDRRDELRWRWTSNGEYSSKSAYRAQLHGSFCQFDADTVWKAHTESKHKSFAWLLIQSKILTMDKLQARNWPCNLVCPLCKNSPETVEHMSSLAVHYAGLTTCCYMDRWPGGATDYEAWY